EVETLRAAFGESAKTTAAVAKPWLDAKTAADKAASTAAALVKSAAARATTFETATPKLSPTAIKLYTTLQYKSPFLSCSFDPSGEYVFAGAHDNSIQRFDLATGSQTALAGHRSW